ncbi:PA1571 family protein [Gynuella sunshinyii]|uniref:Uncharacterized protein n=1 Tax=Gynuella sunshinyii YC6258 TaxID=1445510 RepID=A0A0C5V656_9GAMM|nr:PA1571 family protein [Gynuella sunshinyii]AJQ94945.1 hypothetical Protein YC6258_02907 [Gynuella sunshinyii YC6258]
MTQQYYSPGQRPDFHGAAILDDEGNETPITEEMIFKACVELMIAQGQDEAIPEKSD